MLYVRRCTAVFYRIDAVNVVCRLVLFLFSRYLTSSRICFNAQVCSSLRLTCVYRVLTIVPSHFLRKIPNDRQSVSSKAMFSIEHGGRSDGGQHAQKETDTRRLGATKVATRRLRRIARFVCLYESQ